MVDLGAGTGDIDLNITSMDIIKKEKNQINKEKNNAYDSQTNKMYIRVYKFEININEIEVCNIFYKLDLSLRRPAKIAQAELCIFYGLNQHK